MAVGVHTGDDRFGVRRPRVPREPGQWKRPYLARAERFGDEQRPVREVALGRDELDLYELRRQLVQRQRRFEGGNAAADDHDSGSPGVHAGSVRRGPGLFIGTIPDPGSGISHS